ncbi:MAG: SDR family NAD(P)-dependent oxidoreductase [Myxococcota bacterium]
MHKTILITGATDGIGLEAAKLLAASGHHLLLHGRNPEKLQQAIEAMQPGSGRVAGYVADLSRVDEVESFAEEVANAHDSLDVLINNAGVFRVPNPRTDDNLDVRFLVNTIAPFLLTRRLLPLFGPSGRVINLSSAAQAPVNLRALAGEVQLPDNAAYAQSKLAITMWSSALAASLGAKGPTVVAVNPGSMLGTKMVKEAYGVPGGDIRIGAEILCRAALSAEFADASGKYFDNDAGRFAPPHPDALDPRKSQDVVRAIEATLGRLEGRRP